MSLIPITPLPGMEHQVYCPICDDQPLQWLLRMRQKELLSHIEWDQYDVFYCPACERVVFIFDEKQRPELDWQLADDPADAERVLANLALHISHTYTGIVDMCWDTHWEVLKKAGYAVHDDTMRLPMHDEWKVEKTEHGQFLYEEQVVYEDEKIIRLEYVDGNGQVIGGRIEAKVLLNAREIYEATQSDLELHPYVEPIAGDTNREIATQQLTESEGRRICSNCFISVGETSECRDCPFRIYLR